MNELDQQCNAYESTGPYYNECILTCRWFSERMVQQIKLRNYQTLISLGVGYTAVNQSIIHSLGQLIRYYWIVDGSQSMLEKAKRELELPANTELVKEWFERFDPHEKVDAIEMECILEHVADPLGLLKYYAGFLNKGGTIFIAVPNAQSLHRRIGQAAGVLDDLYTLSEYDLGFGHQRYFDVQTLTDLVKKAGLSVRKVEGIMLKPLTTSQLQKLDLSEQVMTALFKVAIEYPELANCIYLEATL